MSRCVVQSRRARSGLSISCEKPRCAANQVKSWAVAVSHRALNVTGGYKECAWRIKGALQDSMESIALHRRSFFGYKFSLLPSI